jgi:hypothetical protein
MSEEKSYVMRELEGDDAFLMIRILSKIGIDRLKACMEASSVKAAVAIVTSKDADASAKEAAMNSVGIALMLEVASTVMERLPDCRNEIYTLLAQVSGQTVEDIAHMKLIPLTRMIKEFFRKPEFSDFFTEVIELLN